MSETPPMVETVAMALCEAADARWDAQNFNETPNGETPEEMREYFRDQARAALKATGYSGFFLALGLMLSKPITEANRAHFAKKCMEAANEINPGLADDYLNEIA
jgi:hypothetical protein